MVIIVDTREHPEAIKNILREFERQGVRYEMHKLDVGDYIDPERPSLVIDRKKDLNELCGNLFNPGDRGRFWREIKRARDGNIHLIILCEHGGQIKTIQDVEKWHSKYTRVSGRDLMEKIYRVHIAYGVEFVFCDKRVTGKKIIELLERG